MTYWNKFTDWISGRRAKRIAMMKAKLEFFRLLEETVKEYCEEKEKSAKLDRLQAENGTFEETWKLSLNGIQKLGCSEGAREIALRVMIKSTDTIINTYEKHFPGIKKQINTAR